VSSFFTESLFRLVGVCSDLLTLIEFCSRVAES